MRSLHARLIVVSVVIGLGAWLARAQVSTDEAEQRLHERQAARAHAPATAPANETQRLREENRRLRLRVVALQQEVDTLKGALARASASAAGPTSRPAEDPAAKALVGRWRGGDITTGAGYVIEFNPDGTYHQNFISYDQKDVGHYRIVDGVLEMWSDKAPADRIHNQYRLMAGPSQLSLTPVVLDGAHVPHGTPRVLRRAE